ncbi:hypothetical protein WA026_022376 [Henosepilachna vigintioctopunctata]|uniref:Uncharacterized protein n=1 Tax=Henosepilachna vigintioctopunctata TaxID=420089 RepID=A0AAW1V2U6_9CUCU
MNETAEETIVKPSRYRPGARGGRESRGGKTKANMLSSRTTEGESPKKWHIPLITSERLGGLVMEDNCTMRPCATDFSIAAIMSRHGRGARTRCRERDPADNIGPLGTRPATGWYLLEKEMVAKLINCQVRYSKIKFGKYLQ